MLVRFDSGWDSGIYFLFFSFSWMPIFVSLLISSFFPQERGFVRLWSISSDWVPVIIFLFSYFFPRKGILFYPGYLKFSSFWRVPRLLFLLSGKRFYSIMDFLFSPSIGCGSGACIPFFLFLYVPNNSICILAIWGLY